MKFEERVPGTGVVSMPGEYDLGDVEAAVVEFNKLDDLHVAIIDLSKTEYMDSSMLGLLVQVYKRCRARNQPVYFVRPTAGLTRVFTIIGLDKILPLFDSLETALGAAKSAARKAAGRG